jgi:hypothetical protein
MTRGFASAWMLVGFAALALACNKEKKDGDDAAAEAAVAVVDAAPEAEAPAASASASAAPLATPVVVKTAAKPAFDPPICVNARAARARNSPAATNLEAQCKAAGGKP